MAIVNVTNATTTIDHLYSFLNIAWGPQPTKRTKTDEPNHVLPKQEKSNAGLSTIYQPVLNQKSITTQDYCQQWFPIYHPEFHSLQWIQLHELQLKTENPSLIQSVLPKTNSIREPLNWLINHLECLKYNKQVRRETHLDHNIRFSFCKRIPQVLNLGWTL